MQWRAKNIKQSHAPFYRTDYYRVRDVERLQQARSLGHKEAFYDLNG